MLASSAGVRVYCDSSFKMRRRYDTFSTAGLSVASGSVTCVCPVQHPEYDSAYGVCHAAAAQTLSISSVIEIRPAGTDGASTLQVAGKVTSGSQPKAGVVVSFSVDVTAKSGGHDHDDPIRPKGTLSSAQGTTDANGEVKVTFTAPEIAGVHTTKATGPNWVSV